MKKHCVRLYELSYPIQRHDQIRPENIGKDKKYYDELQYFEQYMETLKKNNIDLKTLNPRDPNLAPEEVAVAFYNHEASEIFRNDNDLEWVVKIFKPNSKFNVLVDRWSGYDEFYDSVTELESENLKVIYTYSSVYFGSETNQILEINNKKNAENTLICVENRNSHINNEKINDLILYIDKNA
ncbi:MAG: hypothetical protein Q7S33_02275 [Nanoarchaeota archaeon]|nr:hypothetical protein [Nanoarchaeota archaeon]